MRRRWSTSRQLLCSRRRRRILRTCMNHEGSGGNVSRRCRVSAQHFSFLRVSRWSFVWKTNVRFEEKTHTVLKSWLQICLKKKKKKLLSGADAETRQRKRPLLPLYVSLSFQFSFSLLSQRFAFTLVRFRHKSHIFRLKKTSRFGLKHAFCSSPTRLTMVFDFLDRNSWKEISGSC